MQQVHQAQPDWLALRELLEQAEQAEQQDRKDRKDHKDLPEPLVLEQQVQAD